MADLDDVDIQTALKRCAKSCGLHKCKVIAKLLRLLALDTTDEGNMLGQDHESMEVAKLATRDVSVPQQRASLGSQALG